MESVTERVSVHWTHHTTKNQVSALHTPTVQCQRGWRGGDSRGGKSPGMYDDRTVCCLVYSRWCAAHVHGQLAQLHTGHTLVLRTYVNVSCLVTGSLSALVLHRTKVRTEPREGEWMRLGVGVCRKGQYYLNGTAQCSRLAQFGLSALLTRLYFGWTLKILPRWASLWIEALYAHTQAHTQARTHAQHNTWCRLPSREKLDVLSALGCEQSSQCPKCCCFPLIASSSSSRRETVEVRSGATYSLVQCLSTQCQLSSGLLFCCCSLRVDICGRVQTYGGCMCV